MRIIPCDESPDYIRKASIIISSSRRVLHVFLPTRLSIYIVSNHMTVFISFVRAGLSSNPTYLTGLPRGLNCPIISAYLEKPLKVPENGGNTLDMIF